MKIFENNKIHYDLSLEKTRLIFFDNEKSKKFHFGLIIWENKEYLWLLPINKIKNKDILSEYDINYENKNLSNSKLKKNERFEKHELILDLKFEKWILEFDYKNEILTFEKDLLFDNISSFKGKKNTYLLKMDSYACLKNINQITKCKNIENFYINIFLQIDVKNLQKFIKNLKFWICKNSKMKYKDYFLKKNFFMQKAKISEGILSLKKINNK